MAARMERSAAGVRDEARKRRASRAAKITRQRQQREHLRSASSNGGGCAAERSGPENADREAAHGAAKQAQNRRRHEHDAQICPDAQHRADGHIAVQIQLLAVLPENQPGNAHHGRERHRPCQIAHGLRYAQSLLGKGGRPLAHGLFRRACAEHHHHEEPEHAAFDERAQR